VVAVTVGAVIGCLLGWAFATLPVARWFLQAPIEILRLVPSLIAVPFLVLWFGIGAVPQFVLVVGYTALVMQVAAFTVVRDFPPHVIHFAQTLGSSRWSTATTVLLPGSLPGLLGSLRVTLQLAWGLAVVAELMGAQVGIGRVMSSAATLFRTDYVVAGVVWIAVIAAITDTLFRLGIRTATAWARD
jgi:ABC-type nitrate/sulfonate/bicarbonate transport system permease component